MRTNHKHKFATVILAAGKGTRMRSRLPKVMHPLAGRPLIGHVMQLLASLKPQIAVLVVAPGMEDVLKTAQEAYPGCTAAIQDKQLGTGHAVQSAKKFLAGYDGTVLVLYGDTPLISATTLENMLETTTKHDVVVFGMRPTDPTGYGRLVVEKGKLVAIIECKDASAEQKKNGLCNSGVMALKASHLFNLLEKMQPKNAAGEYYLTDIIALANQQGLQCGVVEAPAFELAGINSRQQLAEAEAMLQQKLREKAMEGGATLIDPASVFLAADTELAEDVVIHPNVIFGLGVKVESNVEIRSFSHIDGAHIKSGAIVGPFARLRPGSVLEENSHVGNFVELKKTRLGKGAKANHLSYVGDSEVGEGANIGAGTITCNYDGVNKHKTVIGAHAFIGSNTALVAPVTVGEGAIIGAGSVITKDVEPGALALERTAQVNKAGLANKLKQKQKKNG